MKDNKLNITAVVIAAAGIALILYGVLTGGYISVLRKAVYICMECVGLG